MVDIIIMIGIMGWVGSEMGILRWVVVVIVISNIIPSDWLWCGIVIGIVANN